MGGKLGGDLERQFTKGGGYTERLADGRWRIRGICNSGGVFDTRAELNLLKRGC